MYNPTLLLLCTQWMVGHIIDTWLNKFWWNQLSNSQNTTLKKTNNILNLLFILFNYKYMYSQESYCSNQSFLFLYIWLTILVLTGIIPAHGQTEVSVTFAPLEFQTALMKIQLTISQFNSQPIVCTFMGVSTPGLLK